MTKWTIPADLAAAQAEADALRARVAELEAALTDIEALDPEHLIELYEEETIRGLVRQIGEIARAALAASREGEACGGCGETDPSKRCIGCFHDFTNQEDKP